MLTLEPGFEPADFRTEPMRKVPLAVNGDADVALFHDCVNIDVAKNSRMNLDVHLERTFGGDLRD